MLNTRKGSTPLSYAIQPGAQYLYDHVARRVIRYVETVVPTINQAEDGATRGVFIPSDRYYGHLGAASGSSALPLWLQTVISSVSYQNYDSGGAQYYLRVGAAGAGAVYNNTTMPLIWPTGPFGVAPAHAPKNATAAAVWVKFRGRFADNSDYTTYGSGAGTAPANRFATATDHFIQVCRNAGNWELGSCDGATISQSAASGGDGNFHDFWVRWERGVSLKLYVDQVLVITKTTNLPARPLFPLAGTAENGTRTVDLVDYLIEWELA